MTIPTMVRQASDTGPILHLLESQVRGAVHVPGDAAYEAQRDAYRGSPAVVVEAAGADDVRVAIRSAREFGMELTVQSTGHGTV
ncbi:MAG: FAD-binding protein, partial [Thermocrispum sp.]